SLYPPTATTAIYTLSPRRSSDLEDHRFGDDGAGVVEGERAGELVAGLEARDGARERGHEQHDEQRAVAHRDRLLECARHPDAPLGEPAEQVDHEEAEPPHVVERAEARARDQS